MEKSNQKVDGIREQLRHYELTPSDRVWQGIEAAGPKPLPPPPRPRMWAYGAAAILMVAASFVLYQVYHQSSSDMEQLDVLVPRVAATDTTGDFGTPGPDQNTSGQPDHIADEAPGNQHNTVTPEPSGLPAATPEPTAASAAGNTTNGEEVTVPPATVPVRAQTRRVQVPTPTPEEVFSPKPGATTPPTEIVEHPVDVPVEEPVVPEDLVKWEMPNAFVPNFDGVNDYFKPVIVNHAEVTGFKMQIYTRSGNLLFESTHIDNGWDGRHNGNMVPPQVYIWAVSFRDMEGKPYARRGYVTLIR